MRQSRVIKVKNFDGKVQIDKETCKHGDMRLPASMRGRQIAVRRTHKLIGKSARRTIRECIHVLKICNNRNIDIWRIY